MAQILATVKVISDLRAYTSFSPGTASNPATGDDVTVIVQGYNTPGDGGGGTFVWKRYSDMFYGNPTYVPSTAYEDGGVFIDSNNTTTFTPIGIWVRQFSGYIDVRFYGVSGGGANWTTQIQKAIDHAARSIENPANRPFGHTTSNTVLIPNGEYVVSQLIIKSGVTIMGTSMQNTTIKSLDDSNYCLIRIPSGIVRDVHVMNLTFYGNAATYNYTTPKNKSCFYFNAVDLNGQGGGLWESSFRNVAVRKFTGHSFYFEGGTTPDYYRLVNQFITMEGINVESVGELAIGHPTFNNNYHALELKGLNGQFAFNNCRFDGGSYLFDTEGNPSYKVNGIVVYIGTSTTGINPAMINFNTCSIQNGEVGLHIESSNNVNVNGCWFEFFERAIVVRGEYRISKAINIQGSSFLDSAGKYGDKPLGSGRIITIQNAQVNAQNNYVIDSTNTAEASHFIYVDPITIGGVTSTPNLGATATGNYFENKKLGDTVGLKKDLNVDNLIPANVINIEGAKAIYLKNTSGSTKTIKEIISSVAAGELIFLRADQGNVVLDETKNLYLGNKVTLPMNAGDVALFVKIDQPIGALSYQYNLIAFLPKI